MSAVNTLPDAAFDDWIARARKGKIRDFLERRGLFTRRMLGDAGNPCPGCGGNDRFAVNLRKNVFICRKSGEGGDAIALAMHLDGCDFLAAVETVTGEPRPGRSATETVEERQKREAASVARARADDAKRRADEAKSNSFRENERRRAREIWNKAFPIKGTIAEDYLRKRGLAAPRGARLRFSSQAKLWSRSPDDGGKLLHCGPALVAGVTGPNGYFAGIEQIWIDLAQPKGKALVANPETGELAPAKKMRGSMKGGSVLLAPAACTPRHIFLGEGIETVLSVFYALAAAGSPLLEVAEFRAALSLCNLAGLAMGRVQHPTGTYQDTRGRLRRRMTPNDVPVDPSDDWPLIAIPETVEELTLLGDGDSEPFMTSLAMRRAAARFARGFPWLTVRLAWPKEGCDFNDQWREERGEAA